MLKFLPPAFPDFSPDFPFLPDFSICVIVVEEKPIISGIGGHTHFYSSEITFLVVASVVIAILMSFFVAAACTA